MLVLVTLVTLRMVRFPLFEVGFIKEFFAGQWHCTYVYVFLEAKFIPYCLQPSHSRMLQIQEHLVLQPVCSTS